MNKVKGGVMKKPKRVTAVLEEELIDRVMRQALYQSHLEGRRITISSAIRRALEVCYPEEKQKEMF